MITLLRLFLKIWGKTFPEVPYFTEVSKTIDSIPAPKRSKWFWGGLLHTFPVVIVLAILFTVRLAEIRHSAREIIALLLATTWVWLGPVLIWHYEKVTLHRFARNCKAIVVDVQDYKRIRNLICSNIWSFTFCRFFIPIWMTLAAVAFVRANDFVAGFGVNGFHDILWWLILFGVLVVAYYTSLGFCLSYKAYRLTEIVSKSRLDRKIYHVDGIFGLSFIGDFAFITAAMFFSGWLFGPLIVLSVNQRSLLEYLYSTPVLLLGILFIFTILSFLVPVYMIHYKILMEKRVRTENFYKAANQLSDIPETIISEDHLKRFDFAKKLIAEVQAMPNWPLRVDTVLKFSVTSILVPAVAGLFAAILKAKAGAP